LGNKLRPSSGTSETDDVKNLDVSWVVDAARVAEG
jgi:hypothetical protein